jgi:hypothetical protein
VAQADRFAVALRSTRASERVASRHLGVARFSPRFPGVARRRVDGASEAAELHCEAGYFPLQPVDSARGSETRLGAAERPRTDRTLHAGPRLQCRHFLLEAGDPRLWS